MRRVVERHVALIRGINVGRAKRIAMTDLRALVEALGYRDVRTLLNSGNIVFSAAGKSAGAAAGRIERAIAGRLGITARVTVLSASDLAAVIRGNPLLTVANNPSRLLVTVLRTPADRARLASLASQDWTPEVLAVGGRVAYVWCADGIHDSRLMAAVGRELGDAVTSRNWATFTRLHALAAQAD